MSDVEHQMEELELELPRKAGEVFADAYRKAIASGLTVLVSMDGNLFEVKADGTRRFIRRLAQDHQPQQQGQQQPQQLPVAEIGKAMPFRWKSKPMA